MPASSRRQGQQRQREQAGHVDERDGGKAAGSVIGVQPSGGEHLELEGRAGRGPAGQDAADGIPRQPGRHDREPRTGSQRQALQTEVAGERGHFRGQGRHHPGRSKAGEARPRGQHPGQLGQQQVDDQAADGDDDSVAQQQLPGQRAMPGGRGGLARSLRLLRACCPLALPAESARHGSQLSASGVIRTKGPAMRERRPPGSRAQALARSSAAAAATPSPAWTPARMNAVFQASRKAPAGSPARRCPQPGRHRPGAARGRKRPACWLQAEIARLKKLNRRDAR